MKIANILIAVFLICSPGWAVDLSAEQTESGVSYYSGGVGLDLRQVMNQRFGHYALRVEHAEKGGAYTADVQMRIYDKAGSMQLDILMHGPILLIDLPAGEYRLEAEQSGRTQQRSARIVAGKQTKITFLWAPPG